MDHLMHLEHCISESFAKLNSWYKCSWTFTKPSTWHGDMVSSWISMLMDWGNLPIFVHNFLQDRTFSVKLPCNVFPDIYVQENLVPQGSVLSPTLFCFMINNILSSTPVPRNLKYSLYADDCALWHSSPNAQLLAGRIQIALESVHQWASLW